MTNRGRLGVAAAALAIGGTAAVGAAARSGPGAAPGPRPDRWHAVTVYRAPQDVGSPGRWPEPIARLGDRVEVRVRPAPGDRGTELAVRAVAGHRPGESPDAAELEDRIREALRHSRMLLETGEVLQPDRPSTTRPTMTSLPLRLALRRSQGGGRL
jgi:hypothetical protein